MFSLAKLTIFSNFNQGTKWVVKEINDISGYKDLTNRIWGFPSAEA